MDRFRLLLIILACFFVFGAACTEADSSDMDALKDKINAVTPDQLTYLKRVGLRAGAKAWLKDRPQGDRVASIMCREVDADGNVDPGPGTEMDWMNVYDMYMCLMIHPEFVYTECMDDWSRNFSGTSVRDFAEIKDIPKDKVHCEPVYDWRYAPGPQSELAHEVWDPKAIDADDIARAVIELPFPPPGWIIPELLPFLCVLSTGKGWCPGEPNYPGPSPSAGASSGDYHP